MTQQQKVREFWDSQAAIEEGEATCPDFHFRSVEIREIMRHLRGGERVLDIGCGNGYSTRKFAATFPGSKFVGADYSATMISRAQSAENPLNVSFLVHDVLKPVVGSFDAIVSERCLINLAGWKEQKRAICNLYDALRPGGRLIMVENTLDGLARLNGLRKRFGLSEIKVRWHNQYFDVRTLRNFLAERFAAVDDCNIGNIYHIVSKVIHAAVAKQEGREPRYDDVLNELAAQLPVIDGPYSPTHLWAARR